MGMHNARMYARYGANGGLTVQQWVVVKNRAFEAGFEGREFNFASVGAGYVVAARESYANGQRARVESDRDAANGEFD